MNFEYQNIGEWSLSRRWSMMLWE